MFFNLCYKLQTPNHASRENDTAWKFKSKNTHKHTFEYIGAEKQTAEEVGFRHLCLLLLSHTKLLTSIAYKLKQLLSYFTHRTTSLFRTSPFQPGCLQTGKSSVLASWGSVKFQHDTILGNKQEVEVKMCAYCTCTVHMQPHFTTLCL